MQMNDRRKRRVIKFTNLEDVFLEKNCRKKIASDMRLELFMKITTSVLTSNKNKKIHEQHIN